VSILDYRTPEWVAEQLGIDKNTLYRHLHDGTIPALQLGRKWLISESRLVEWLDSESQNQTQARRDAAVSADRTSRRMSNYAPRARTVVRVAHGEARRYGHDYLGREHLVLAMACDPECAASRVMAELGVDRDRLVAAFESRFDSRDEPPPKRLARSTSDKQAMRLAAQEATQTGSQLVGTGHLLLGILKAGDGPGYDMLAELKVTLDATQERLLQLTDID